MAALRALANAIDSFNEALGRLASWATLFVVIVCCTVVVLRYAFSAGFVWMQELYVWLHAAAFMLAAGYTLKHDGHVRVDIFYARMSPRGRAWVNLFGCFVFLFPWVAVTLIYGLPFAESAFAIREPSGQAGGLAGLWLVKGLVVVMGVVLGLAGLSLSLRSLLVLAGEKSGLKDEDHLPSV
jgi:TRAP-type mannitol/chloroaromatic compound transport system permease small subunit